MAGGVALGRGLFLRATMESLESVSSPSVAQATVWAALNAAQRTEVPEEIAPFRAFVEGPLRQEVQRQLGPEAVSHVLERLGHVLWMATSDVHALDVARAWATGSIPGIDDSADAESGEFAVATVPFVAYEPRKRPTDQPSPPQASPPVSTQPPQPGRAPQPVSVPRPRPTGVTLGKLSVSLTRVAAPRALPSCVLVLSLDPMLATQTKSEIAGRCDVVKIATPADLARAASSAGERVVVMIDTALPSIDLRTFVGLAPILPANTRVVLWGADERQRTRLVAMFAIAATWFASADATQPGEFVLALPAATA